MPGTSTPTQTIGATQIATDDDPDPSPDDTGSGSGSGGGDTDTDTGSGGSGGGGGGSTSSSPPEITSVTISDRDGTLSVEFTQTDADGDMTGGSVTLVVDGTTYTFAIPGDLDRWQAAGSSKVSLDYGLCVLPPEVEVTLRLTDSAGNRSTVEKTTYAVTASGILLDTSVSDDAGPDYAYDVGSIAKGTVMCGNLYSIRTNWTGDNDYIFFKPTSSGSHTLRLAWSMTADLDIWLATASGSVLTQSYVTSSTGPEIMTYTLTGGTEYLVRVVGWDGTAGDWTLTLQ